MESWSISFAQGGMSVGQTVGQLHYQPLKLHDFATLQAALRQVALKGDPTVKPYQNAIIALKRFPIAALSPLSLYVLNPQLTQHRRMFWHLLNNYQQNLFDLTGFVDYTQDGTEHRIAPPIVEFYQEPTTGQWVSAIVDGLHRIYAAKQFGFTDVWAVEVSNVRPDLPLIALPTDWNELKVYDATPPSHAKRHYRYNSLADIPPDVAKFATEDNYQYFLYRDFAALGSEGIRPTA